MLLADDLSNRFLPSIERFGLRCCLAEFFLQNVTPAQSALGGRDGAFDNPGGVYDTQVVLTRNNPLVVVVSTFVAGYNSHRRMEEHRLTLHNQINVRTPRQMFTHTVSGPVLTY